ncbi:MAG: tRNA (adenosine(37)-N6)-dimethylallyltransferase MiaA [Microgenomates group bacterium]
MDKLLIICGPTATGKTKLGISLAKEFNGEIVSADSRQVYRGMDVGTGKDLGESTIYNVQFTIKDFRIGYYKIDGVKVWLLDVVNPDYKFNVADYKKCADLVIDDILRRGKLPIVVGGTGFYIKAVLEGIGTMGIEPDWELRERLSHCSIASLLEILTKLDPERIQRMSESDRKNPRRLIRAIEIARKGKGQSAKCKVTVESSKLDTLFIGLTAPNKILYKKIDQRVEERMNMGLEDEIRGLLAKGYNFANSALGTTLAYREWQEYFEGKKTKDEVIQNWKFDEHEYSRRQMTWFRRDSRINWFDITDETFREKVEKLVGNWYIDSKSTYQQNSKREW